MVRLLITTGLVLALTALLGGCPERPLGLFEDHHRFGTGTRTPRALRVGDLDGDGDPDLVVASAQGPEISIYFNQGPGLVSPALNIDLETSEQVIDLHVVRLEPGGPIHLALLLDQGVALLSNPDGRGFGIAPGGRVARCQDCRGFLPGDFDGDGLTDFLVFSDAATDLYLGPDYETTVQPRPPRLLLPPTPVATDFDQGGRWGVLGRVEGSPPSLSALRGLPDGTFQTLFGLPENDIEVVARWPAEDFCGVGALAAAGRWGCIANETQEAWLPVEGLQPTALIAFDAGGSASIDVVVGDGRGLLHVFVGRSAGRFLALPPLEVSGTPVAFAHADLDADGVEDLLYLLSGGDAPGLYWSPGGVPPEDGDLVVLQ